MGSKRTEKKKRQRKNKKVRENENRLELILFKINGALDVDEYNFILAYIKRGYAWSYRDYLSQQQAHRTFELMKTNVELGDDYNENPHGEMQPIVDSLETAADVMYDPEYLENSDDYGPYE